MATKIKIACGIDKVSDIAPLAEAGADEFFCGVLGRHALNGRPGTPRFSLGGLKELALAVRASHSHGAELWLALNFPSSSEPLFEEALELRRQAARLGVDGLIVSDPVFLARGASLQPAVKTAVSTLLPKLNLEAVEFLRQFKPARLVLERQTTVAELKRLDSRLDGLELEIFGFAVCGYMNAFCDYEKATGRPHFADPLRPGRGEGGPCRLPLDLQLVPPRAGGGGRALLERVKENLFRPNSELLLSSLADLSQLRGLRNSLVLKVASRGLPLASKLVSVGRLKSALSFFARRPGRGEYLRFCGELLGEIPAPRKGRA